MNTVKLTTLMVSISLLSACNGPEPLYVPNYASSASPAPTPTNNPSSGVNMPEVNNKPPVIQTLSANPTATTGKDGSITFTINVFDHEGEKVNLFWYASRGTLSSQSGTQVTWKATEKNGEFRPGTAVIEVVATDTHRQSTTGSLRLIIDNDGSAHLQEEKETTNTEEKQPKEIKVNQSTFDVAINEEAHLQAELIFDDGSKSSNVYWYTPDQDKIILDGTGRILRRTAGEALIIVRTELSSGVEARIRVLDPERVEATPENSASPTPEPTSSPTQNPDPSNPTDDTDDEPNEETPDDTSSEEEITAPQQPTGLSTSAVQPTSLKLQWAPVTGADNYKVYLNNTAVGIGVNTTNYTFTDISSNTNHTLGVSALNSAGESPIATTTVSTPPIILGAPTNLQASNVGTNSVNLTWDPVPGAQTYKLYSDSSLTATALTNSTTLSTVYPGGVYNLSVSAVSPDGESPVSEAVQIETLMTAGQEVVLNKWHLYSHLINDNYFFNMDNNHVYASGSKKIYRSLKYNGTTPEEIYTSTQSIHGRPSIINNNLLYFVESSSGTYTFKKLNLNTKEVTQLGQTTTDVNHLQEDSTHIYYLNFLSNGNRRIQKINKSNGSITNVVPTPEERIDTFTLSGSHIFYGAAKLMKVSTSGGSSSQIAEFSCGIKQLYSYNGQVYVVTGMKESDSQCGLHKVNPSNGQSTQLQGRESGQDTNIESLHFDSNTVYYNLFLPGKSLLMKQSLSGGSPVEIKSYYQGRGISIKSDSSHLYLNFSEGQMTKMLK